jgi:hypothetical protein
MYPCKTQLPHTSHFKLHTISRPIHTVLHGGAFVIHALWKRIVPFHRSFARSVLLQDNDHASTSLAKLDSNLDSGFKKQCASIGYVISHRLGCGVSGFGTLLDGIVI